MITENGQVGKAETFALLERCCRRVGEVYGQPDADRWTNGDYISLSQFLFRQTRVRISPNTLKRIFGKIRTDARYYPQKATRDALAVYIGCLDWDHFVRLQESDEQSTLQRVPLASQARSPIPAEPEAAPATPSKPRIREFLLLGVAALLIVGGGLLWWYHNRQQPLPRLVCRNPLGENPHSAVFQLKGMAERSESDVYTLQFGDGKQLRITPADSLYSHYYERPGRYFAVLQRNGRAIDTATIYLRTHGWAVTASMLNDTTRVYPISVTRLFSGGRHGISTAEALHAGVDTNRTFFVEFANSQPTAIDGDNFELTTHVNTSPDRPGVRCSQASITVWGESAQHELEVMKPGCVHWIVLDNAEIHKIGARDDLSFMGADLRTGGTLTLRVADKRTSFFINNRKVYEARYTKPLHHIYGVRIRFAGIGTVDSFRLRDLRTDSLFSGNF